jgi:hypothetical protein
MRTKEALFLRKPTSKKMGELDNFPVRERDKIVYSEFQQ